MNRCKKIGLDTNIRYLNSQSSRILRNEIDRYIEEKIVEWDKTVPYADHFEGKNINKLNYQA